MKNYELKFEDRGNYLFAHVSGKESFESSLGYWTEISELYLKKPFEKILVYEELEGTIPKSDIFKLNIELGKLHLNKIKQIVCVDKFSSNQKDNNFGVSEGLKHGIKMILFNNFEDAVEYISH